MPWTPRGWVDETGKPWQDPTQDPSLRVPVPTVPVSPRAPITPGGSSGQIPPGGSAGQTPPFVPADEQSRVPGAGGGDPLVELLLKTIEETALERRKLLDPEYQRGVADIQVDAYQRMAAIAQEAALEKSREKSRREIELQNMRSWADITRAQIDREARLAESLARTAYISHTPNANVLSALAPTVQQATAAYKQPQSVFPS